MRKIINTQKNCLCHGSHDDQGGRKIRDFTLPIGKEKYEIKIISNVHTYDFHVVAIRAEKDTPQFFYTIGLYYQYQHPELLIMGMEVNDAHAILMNAHELIKNGGTIAPWTTSETLSIMPLKAVPIHVSDYKQFLGFGMWFYRSLQGSRPDSFPAIQLVASDLPRDPGVNAQIRLSA
jgi:hypothetical protein